MRRLPVPAQGDMQRGSYFGPLIGPTVGPWFGTTFDAYPPWLSENPLIDSMTAWMEQAAVRKVARILAQQPRPMHDARLGLPTPGWGQLQGLRTAARKRTQRKPESVVTLPDYLP